MSIKHPKYPNPTIKEALCEIHFDLPEEKWKTTVYGEFFKSIQNEFPDMEPVSQFRFQFQAGSAGIEHTVLPPRQTMRYWSANRNKLLQLSEGILTINLLPVYPGWQVMLEEILGAWRHACKVVRPESVIRLGLRYINHIERESNDEFPENWLKASDYLPAIALRSLPGFLARTEARIDKETRLIVTLGEGEGELPPIVLDIDCITEKKMGIDSDEIKREVERLHDLEWKVFSASITPRLEQKLKGEKEGFE